MSLGIFILPTNSCKKDIINFKNKIKKMSLTNATYCSHPPHLTLTNIQVLNLPLALDKVSKGLGEMKSFHINISTRGVFWNDPATGYNTLYFKVDHCEELFLLQKKISSILLPIINKKSPPKYVKENSLLLNSYLKYGFPFIGDHWIPHFSIASISYSRNKSFFKNFLNKKKIIVLKLIKYHAGQLKKKVTKNY